MSFDASRLGDRSGRGDAAEKEAEAAEDAAEAEEEREEEN